MESPLLKKSDSTCDIKVYSSSNDDHCEEFACIECNEAKEIESPHTIKICTGKCSELDINQRLKKCIKEKNLASSALIRNNNIIPAKIINSNIKNLIQASWFLSLSNHPFHKRIAKFLREEAKEINDLNVALNEHRKSKVTTSLQRLLIPYFGKISAPLPNSEKLVNNELKQNGNDIVDYNNINSEIHIIEQCKCHKKNNKTVNANDNYGISLSKAFDDQDPMLESLISQSKIISAQNFSSEETNIKKNAHYSSHNLGKLDSNSSIISVLSEDNQNNNFQYSLVQHSKSTDNFSHLVDGMFSEHGKSPMKKMSYQESKKIMESPFDQLNTESIKNINSVQCDSFRMNRHHELSTSVSKGNSAVFTSPSQANIYHQNNFVFPSQIGDKIDVLKNTYSSNETSENFSKTNTENEDKDLSLDKFSLLTISSPLSSNNNDNLNLQKSFKCQPLGSHFNAQSKFLFPDYREPEILDLTTAECVKNNSKTYYGSSRLQQEIDLQELSLNKNNSNEDNALLKCGKYNVLIENSRLQDSTSLNLLHCNEKNDSTKTLNLISTPVEKLHSEFKLQEDPFNNTEIPVNKINDKESVNHEKVIPDIHTKNKYNTYLLTQNMEHPVEESLSIYYMTEDNIPTNQESIEDNIPTNQESIRNKTCEYNETEWGLENKISKKILTGEDFQKKNKYAALSTGTDDDNDHRDKKKYTNFSKIKEIHSETLNENEQIKISNDPRNITSSKHTEIDQNYFKDVVSPEEDVHFCNSDDSTKTYTEENQMMDISYRSSDNIDQNVEKICSQISLDIEYENTQYGGKTSPQSFVDTKRNKKDIVEDKIIHQNSNYENKFDLDAPSDTIVTSDDVTDAINYTTQKPNCILTSQIKDAIKLNTDSPLSPLNNDVSDENIMNNSNDQTLIGSESNSEILSPSTYSGDSFIDGIILNKSQISTLHEMRDEKHEVKGNHDYNSHVISESDQNSKMITQSSASYSLENTIISIPLSCLPQLKVNLNSLNIEDSKIKDQLQNNSGKGQLECDNLSSKPKDSFEKSAYMYSDAKELDVEILRKSDTTVYGNKSQNIVQQNGFNGNNINMLTKDITMDSEIIETSKNRIKAYSNNLEISPVLKEVNFSAIIDGSNFLNQRIFHELESTNNDCQILFQQDNLANEDQHTNSRNNIKENSISEKKHSNNSEEDVSFLEGSETSSLIKRSNSKDLLKQIENQASESSKEKVLFNEFEREALSLSQENVHGKENSCHDQGKFTLIKTKANIYDSFSTEENLSQSFGQKELNGKENYIYKKECFLNSKFESSTNVDSSEKLYELNRVIKKYTQNNSDDNQQLNSGEDCCQNKIINNSVLIKRLYEKDEPSEFSKNLNTDEKMETNSNNAHSRAELEDLDISVEGKLTSQVSNFNPSRKKCLNCKLSCKCVGNDIQNIHSNKERQNMYNCKNALNMNNDMIKENSTSPAVEAELKTGTFTHLFDIKNSNNGKYLENNIKPVVHYQDESESFLECQDSDTLFETSRLNLNSDSSLFCKKNKEDYFNNLNKINSKGNLSSSNLSPISKAKIIDEPCQKVIYNEFKSNIFPLYNDSDMPIKTSSPKLNRISNICESIIKAKNKNSRSKSNLSLQANIFPSLPHFDKKKNVDENSFESSPKIILTRSKTKNQNENLSLDNVIENLNCGIKTKSFSINNLLPKSKKKYNCSREAIVAKLSNNNLDPKKQISSNYNLSDSLCDLSGSFELSNNTLNSDQENCYSSKQGHDFHRNIKKNCKGGLKKASRISSSTTDILQHNFYLFNGSNVTCTSYSTNSSSNSIKNLDTSKDSLKFDNIRITRSHSSLLNCSINDIIKNGNVNKNSPSNKNSKKKKKRFYRKTKIQINSETPSHSEQFNTQKKKKTVSPLQKLKSSINKNKNNFSHVCDAFQGIHSPPVSKQPFYGDKNPEFTFSEKNNLVLLNKAVDSSLSSEDTSIGKLNNEATGDLTIKSPKYRESSLIADKDTLKKEDGIGFCEEVDNSSDIISIFAGDLKEFDSDMESSSVINEENEECFDEMEEMKCVDSSKGLENNSSYSLEDRVINNSNDKNNSETEKIIVQENDCEMATNVMECSSNNNHFLLTSVAFQKNISKSPICSSKMKEVRNEENIGMEDHLVREKDAIKSSNNNAHSDISDQSKLNHKLVYPPSCKNNTDDGSVLDNIESEMFSKLDKFQTDSVPSISKDLQYFDNSKKEKISNKKPSFLQKSDIFENKEEFTNGDVCKEPPTEESPNRILQVVVADSCSYIGKEMKSCNHNSSSFNFDMHDCLEKANGKCELDYNSVNDKVKKCTNSELENPHNIIADKLHHIYNNNQSSISDTIMLTKVNTQENLFTLTDAHGEINQNNEMVDDCSSDIGENSFFNTNTVSNNLNFELGHNETSSKDYINQKKDDKLDPFMKSRINSGSEKKDETYNHRKRKSFKNITDKPEKKRRVIKLGASREKNSSSSENNNSCQENSTHREHSPLCKMQMNSGKEATTENYRFYTVCHSYNDSKLFENIIESKINKNMKNNEFNLDQNLEGQIPEKRENSFESDNFKEQYSLQEMDSVVTVECPLLPKNACSNYFMENSCCQEECKFSHEMEESALIEFISKLVPYYINQGLQSLTWEIVEKHMNSSGLDSFSFLILVLKPLAKCFLTHSEILSQVPHLFENAFSVSKLEVLCELGNMKAAFEFLLNTFEYIENLKERNCFFLTFIRFFNISDDFEALSPFEKVLKCKYAEELSQEKMDNLKKEMDYYWLQFNVSKSSVEMTIKSYHRLIEGNKLEKQSYIELTLLYLEFVEKFKLLKELFFILDYMEKNIILESQIYMSISSILKMNYDKNISFRFFAVMFKYEPIFSPPESHFLIDVALIYCPALAVNVVNYSIKVCNCCPLVSQVFSILNHLKSESSEVNLNLVEKLCTCLPAKLLANVAGTLETLLSNSHPSKAFYLILEKLKSKGVILKEESIHLINDINKFDPFALRMKEEIASIRSLTPSTSSSQDNSLLSVVSGYKDEVSPAQSCQRREEDRDRFITHLTNHLLEASFCIPFSASKDLILKVFLELTKPSCVFEVEKLFQLLILSLTEHVNLEYECDVNFESQKEITDNVDNCKKKVLGLLGAALIFYCNNSRFYEKVACIIIILKNVNITFHKFQSLFIVPPPSQQQMAMMGIQALFKTSNFDIILEIFREIDWQMGDHNEEEFKNILIGRLDIIKNILNLFSSEIQKENRGKKMLQFLDLMEILIDMYQFDKFIGMANYYNIIDLPSHLRTFVNCYLDGNLNNAQIRIRLEHLLESFLKNAIIIPNFIINLQVFSHIFHRYQMDHSQRLTHHSSHPQYNDRRRPTRNNFKYRNNPRTRPYKNRRIRPLIPPQTHCNPIPNLAPSTLVPGPSHVSKRIGWRSNKRRMF